MALRTSFPPSHSRTVEGARASAHSTWLFATPASRPGKPSTRSVRSQPDCRRRHRQRWAPDQRIVHRVAGHGEVHGLHRRVHPSGRYPGARIMIGGGPGSTLTITFGMPGAAINGRGRSSASCAAMRLAKLPTCCASSNESFMYPAASESPTTTRRERSALSSDRRPRPERQTAPTQGRDSRGKRRTLG